MLESLTRRLEKLGVSLWIWPRLGLGAKMSLIVLAGVLALTGLFGYLGTEALNTNINRLLEERVVVARGAASHVDYALDTIDHALGEAARVEGLDDPTRAEESLQAAFGRVSFFGSRLILLDSDRHIAGVYPASAVDASFRTISWLDPIFSGADFAVSPSTPGPSPADHSVYAAAPVRTGSGRLAGALLLCIDLNGPQMRAFAEPAGLGGSAYMDLVDAEGVILASTRSERPGLSADHSSTLAQMIQSGTPRVSTCHDCHDSAVGSIPRAEVLAFAPLQRAPWGVTLRQDQEEVLATARELQIRIFAAGGLALVGALLLVLITSRSLIQPVRELQVATGRIAEGDLQTPVTASGYDEIAGLARSFDAMRARLMASMAEIRELNAELDQRVQDRTRELEQRNRELASLNVIARTVGQSLVLDECLRLALEEVRRITSIDAGSIFLLEGEDGRLYLRACYGLSEQAAERAGRLGLEDSECGGVLRIGQPVVVQTVRSTTRGSYGPLAEEGLASLVHLPLITRGTPLGTLCLGTRLERSFSDEEVALLGAIANEIAVAVENARLYRELARKEHLRGELLRRLMSAEEDERKRISRELHDETSQILTTLLYSLDTAASSCDNANQPLLNRMRRLTLEALDGVHKLIYDLRPTMLDQLGLAAALRSYAESRFEGTETRVQFVEPSEHRRLPPAVETALFRAGQEALNNVARHAGARIVSITLTFDEEQAELQIEDNGIGFEIGQVGASPSQGSGLGLLSMQERMHAVGGECFVISLPGQGTTVQLRVPMTTRVESQAN